MPSPVKRRSSARPQAGLKLTKGIPGKVVEMGRNYANKHAYDFGNYANKHADDFGKYLSSLYDTVMPEAVGWLTSSVHALLGAFFFVVLMNFGTSYMTPVCTVTEAGVASARCEYQSPINVTEHRRHGEFPNYAQNLFGLAALAFTVTTGIHGIFSALGQTDFTIQAVLGKFVNSFTNRGEPVAYMRTGFVLLGVLVGNLLGVFASGALLGTFNKYQTPDHPYLVVGTGLGGPTVSYSGELLKAGLLTWGFIFLSTLSSLSKLIFYSETQARRSVRDAEGLDVSTEGGLSPALGDRSYGFLSHFQHATALGLFNAALVLVFGPYHGTAGLDLGRDIFNLLLRNLDSERNISDDTGLRSPWALYVGIGLVGWVLGVALHLLMGFIRKRDRKMLD